MPGDDDSDVDLSAEHYFYNAFLILLLSSPITVPINFEEDDPFLADIYISSNIPISLSSLSAL